MRKIFVLMCLLIALDNTTFGQKLTDLQTWYGA